ncbi:MAG: two-component regulator propeller domain-containing protein [Bacteroidales bacterium]
MMMKYFIAILLLCVFPLSIQAQKLPFTNISIQNGLPQNTVNSIVQDDDGYIWFATQVGAARYDGYEFKYYNTSNGLINNFVNCMMVSRAGQVWFGTEGGISVLENGRVRSITVAEGLVNNRVDELMEDGNGNVWAGSAYGLSVITPDSIVTYSKGEALTDNSIEKLFVDSRGRVHVATGPFFGLTIFDNPFTYNKFDEDEVIWDIAEDLNGDILYANQGLGLRVNVGEGSYYLGSERGLTEETVISLMVDHKGRIWCGTYYYGLFIYEEGQFRHIKLGDSGIPVITSFFEDSNDRVWIMSNEGIWLFDDDKYKKINEKDGSAIDQVYDLIEDKFGNIWLGTAGGAYKYGRAIFEILDTDTGLPDNQVYSLFCDSRKRIWCGMDKHLGYISEGILHNIGKSKGFEEGDILPHSFAEDKEGNIYIGSEFGLWYYDGSAVHPKLYNAKEDLDYQWQFYSLLFTPEHELWCATDRGLLILINGEVKIPAGMDQILDLQVNDLELIGESMYCATEGGISVFDLEGDHIANYTVDDSLSSNVCLDLSSDFEGNLWIATDQGLSKMTLGDRVYIEKYRFENGPSSNTTYFVEFSDSCSLWIGTERGLQRMDIISGQTRYYGYDDGFYPLETNQKAVTRGEGHELWIGTVDGLVHYLPKYDVIDLNPPDLILYQPVVHGETYFADPDNPEAQPLIPFKKGSLEFRFTGIHFTIPERNRFSYILEGLDESWSEPGIERSVTYRQIPSGSYVFRVMAYNLDGVSTNEDATFAFTIKPPFWKTIWFIILAVFIGLGLMYAYIKYRERQLVREKRILEAKVKERTQEIEDQKVEIEAQRDRIADQNKGITDSIHYARRIQHAVLPGKLALEKYLPEHFILLKPRDIVSGDFYWVEQKNDRVVICAADCTGHGVPGAFMSLLGLTFLNEIVNKDEILKASEILDQLRSYIINAMSHKDSQAMDGMDIALVVFDRQLSRMEYAGAYNPLLIIRNNEVIEYKADKMPVGIHVGEERPFSNHRIQLEKGDVFYLFSDGFADQFGGPEGGKYKSRSFRRLIQNISSEPMERQQELLEMELKEWMRDFDQVDDILVIGIRYE